MAITNEFSLAERDARRKHVVGSIPILVLRKMWRDENGRMASYLDASDLRKEFLERWPTFSEAIYNWLCLAWEE